MGKGKYRWKYGACGCFFCTGFSKGDILDRREAIADQEMETEIKDYDTNNQGGKT